MVGDDLCIVLVAGQFVELLFDAINEGSFFGPENLMLY